jgi:hypothetical protein
MYRVIYTSLESAPFSKADLDTLLEQSRRNNAAADVTGFLLYANGKFMQLLEGPPDSVRALVAKIRTDPRHCNFIPLMESETPARTFNDWSMGFRRLQPGDVAALGYADFDEMVSKANHFLLNPSNALRVMLSLSGHAQS